MVLESNTLEFLFLNDGKDGVGIPGENGKTLYTWIKYSQNSDGSDMTDDSTDAIYIGLAYNKESSTESENPSDYNWTKIKGNDGEQGDNGYTIILSNENISFSTDNNRKPLSNQTFTCEVNVFQGTTAISDFTIGNLTNINGLSSSVSNHVITLSTTTSDIFNSDSGSISVPIIINGVSFTKTITFSLSKQGEQGSNGISVSSVSVQYYQSTSSTELLGGSWSTDRPTWEDGKYIWSKQITALSNGTSSETAPVCITGGTGNTGATGRSIEDIITEYYLSTSKTEQIGGSWSETQPDWSSGHYVWTRSKIVYSNPSSTEYKNIVCDTTWEAMQSQIDTLTKTMSGVEQKVDANTKSITDKVWQTDITESINNYNNTTIQGIRDSVSQHTTSIDGITSKVSDIETYTGINEEGKLDTSLTERISIVEQTAKGISQTVSETYATKDEVNGLIEESYTATIDHIANEINSSVIDNITGENSYVNQKTESIEQGIKNKIGKEQFDIVKLRYIRDWLYSNDKDSENRYVECKVFDEKGENVALGIIPKAYDSFLSEITTISNLNLYTDNIIDDTNYIYSENLSMLQLDLGKVYENIDKIDVWHYYSDGRSYSHKLDISEDGEKWITLFDSQTDGKYVETNAGKDNKVQTESIIEQISFIRQTLDSYVVKVQNSEDNYSKFQALVNEIRQEVQSTKDGITTISQQIQNSDGWKVMLKSIGAYTGDDADEIDVENYVALSLKPEGVTVTSNEKQGNTLLMKADGMFGYYNDGLSTENEGKGEEIFWVKGDTTYTQRSIVPKGIDFKTMKEIPMNYNGYNGLVFVKGGGDA